MPTPRFYGAAGLKAVCIGGLVSCRVCVCVCVCERVCMVLTLTKALKGIVCVCVCLLLTLTKALKGIVRRKDASPESAARLVSVM